MRDKVGGGRRLGQNQLSSCYPPRASMEQIEGPCGFSRALEGTLCCECTANNLEESG